METIRLNRRDVLDGTCRVKLTTGQLYTLVLVDQPSASTKLRFKLLDLQGKPMGGATVSIAGTTVTADSQGMVETEVDASPGGIQATLATEDVSLDASALDAASTEDFAWKARLFNMGFLWDINADPTDDEMIIALQDFQAEYKVAVTGQLDDATKTKLSEVYGC